MNPRTWDAFLWEADRVVHLGLSPTVLLTNAFTSGAFLRFLDVVYSNLYFVLIAGSVPALLVLPELNRRMAFLAAYTFVWIAGSVVYLAFPSWGPVFVVSSLFAETLRNMPATVHVQEVLFGEISSLVQHPLAPRIIRFGSVAAFPSLHLAVVTTLAVGSRWVSRRWFLANLVVVVLMLVGSVVTGYHYLVDGWAGIVLGLAVLVVVLLLVGSLIPQGPRLRRRQEVEKPVQGPVEQLSSAISRAPRGRYSKWLVANRLGRLAQTLLSQREGDTHRSVFAPLGGSGWEPPQHLQQYLDTGLHGSFSDYPSPQRNVGGASPADPEIEEAVTFLEDQLELHRDRRR